MLFKLSNELSKTQIEYPNEISQALARFREKMFQKQEKFHKISHPWKKQAFDFSTKVHKEGNKFLRKHHFHSFSLLQLLPQLI